jgi:hypothetical protein
MLRRTARRAVAGAIAAAALAAAPAATATAATPPEQGPGGPVLVVTSPADHFGQYYAEILRAEGLNEFAVKTVDTVDAQTLAGYQVVVLAQTTLTSTQASTLTDWVQAGGNLVAMRPDPKLAGLLGLGADTGDLANAYMRIDTAAAPGRGITGATMQFHGTADRWTLAGATPVATLYADAQSATSSPAVTLRSVGSAGGQAAAFSYDLARSVVYTRQGNPAWAGVERDFGIDSENRSDDLFFGAKPGDVQPDWVNLDKVAIPQADEQQRLLANLITGMTLDRMPLPRFWYLPRGDKAAIVMTGDDHGNGGTTGRFHTFEKDSPPGCSVADWQCVRATSYAYPSTPIDPDDANAFQPEGFEIALHLSTGCQNFTLASLRANWADQLPQFHAAWPGLAAPRTNRTHCITWSDWAGEPKAELENGVRLDTNYYYWPGKWVQDRPGMFTGSGFPMRFADTDGSLIDVYQAATQMTDESDIDIPKHVKALLDGALGPEGYYGVFTANMHTDQADHPGADAIVAEATSRGVPVVSAVQMLDWLDGRNDSAFQDLSYGTGTLRFTIAPGAGARGLQAMVPLHATGGDLTGLTRDGSLVTTTTRTLKGVDYAVFDGLAGHYVASYPADPHGGGGPVDATPPETTLGNGAVAGTSASFAFSSDDPSARFECRLDGGAFTACTSPASLAGLTAGAHTFAVRAVDAAGNADGTPATRSFTITAAASLPATPTPPAVTGGAGGATAPRATLRTSRVRADRAGRVRLRVSCVASSPRCTVELVLRTGNRRLAHRSTTVKSGRPVTVTVRLSAGARKRLARARSLRVTALVRTRDAAGHLTTTTTRIRLLAPRR